MMKDQMMMFLIFMSGGLLLLFGAFMAWVTDKTHDKSDSARIVRLLVTLAVMVIIIGGLAYMFLPPKP